ncbi:Major facilitator superfamily transporter [Mycena sanguinolenta]|uniref:Major facilitator superfamily transporter n=1 Tax=Mycena sanguinolenta TaxID=230812 RepID=A0A8H6YZW3_9AGAR|nr:Major facilitator superfamily transporter [Mycena sanguinolenta]
MSKAPSTAEGTLNGSIRRVPSNEKEQVFETQTATSGAEDDLPRGLKLALLMIGLCLGVFLVALDNTIIAVAIPKITDQFKSLDDVGWYGSAYFLAIASTQLLFGKFYSVLPIKYASKVFLTAISIFEIGSLVCGVAPNSNALIVGRAIAGLGSAGIFSGALIIIGQSAHTPLPLSKRPMYTGLIGAMYGISNVAGPLMGGAFTDKLTWRWCFYINLPLGGLSLFIITFFFKMPKSADHKPSETPLTWWQRIDRFDPLGTFIFVPAIVSSLLALQWGGAKYAWNSGRIIALFVIFGVFFCNLRRNTAIKGVSAVKSGIDNLPMLFAVVIAIMGSGGLISAIGYYTPFILLSTVMMSVGGGLLTTFKTNTGHAHWIGYQVIYGLGVGFGMQTPLMGVQTVLELKDIPIGTSINGGAIFVSVAQSVFQNKLISGLAHVPGVSPEIIFLAGATNLKNIVDPQYLSAVLEAYNHALVITFRVGLAMACISIIGASIIEWKSVKGKNIEMGVA